MEKEKWVTFMFIGNTGSNATKFRDSNQMCSVQVLSISGISVRIGDGVVTKTRPFLYLSDRRQKEMKKKIYN